MNPLQRITICLALVLTSVPAWAGAPVDSGALDATFGSSGKVILGPNTGEASPIANDVAVQSDGKIMVVGYETNATDGLESWRIARLNANGSVDTGFASNGMLDWNAGTTGTRAYAVAVRPDGRIVVGGNFENVIEVSQFTSTGSPDPTFAGGQGYILLTPATGDSNYLSRLIIEANGSIDIAGTYYNNENGFNNNNFFFAQISADGKTFIPFQYELGSGPNQDDHAHDLAIDSQGRYVVAGYHRGANGNYDFAAIRILHNLYDVDNTFGSGGQTTVDFGDNGDYANAVAITPTGYIALGGQANGQAALAFLDSNGKLLPEITGYTYDTYQFAFGDGGGADNITKLIVEGYDTDHPQLLAIGSGYQSGVPYGLMFGVARLDLPGYLTFSLDSNFNGNGTESLYFNSRPDGTGLRTTTNHGNSAAYANGKLVVVGDTLGTEMAISRLAAFDGIFKTSFEVPYY